MSCSGGSSVAGLDLGEAGDGLRLDFEHVADFALDVLEPAPRAFHALLGAGGGFAGAGQRFERQLGDAIGFGHRGFGGGERVGGDAAVVFGVFDLGDQRAALLREHGRRVFEIAALDRDFGDARLDGVDVRGRALLAVLPLGALGEDRLHAAVGELGFARQRLRLGADLGGHAAMAFDVAADGGETGFGVLARRQLGERRRRRIRRRPRPRRGRRRGGCALPTASPCARRGG